VRESVAGRKVAVLIAAGVDAAGVSALRAAVEAKGAVAELLAVADGTVTGADGTVLPVTRAISTVASVLYDAVVVPDGADAAAVLRADGYAVHFVAEAYKHGKPLGAVGAGMTLLTTAHLPVAVTAGTVRDPADAGVILAETAGEPFVEQFVEAVAAHRFHGRPVDAIAA
jgi:catalase